MTKIKAIFAWRGAVLATVLMVATGAAQASASSAPIVITYEKTCIEAAGTCSGTTGNGDTLTMAVTGARPTGKAAQLTMTESVVGEVTFSAVLSGHVTPAGFIVLNGTVTGGDHAGARVHQRSNLTGVSIDGTKTTWEGEVRIMPASS
jgi:hypothetical protein